MINFMQFPSNLPIDDISRSVIESFKNIVSEVDSASHRLKSNEVLAKVKPNLEKLGFDVEDVEKGKKNSKKVKIPVLYGKNGEIKKSFKADAYLANHGYIIEVEAGRGVLNHQFLKDFFEACTICTAERLCIAVRNEYITKNKNSSKDRISKDFDKVCTFFEALYASNRLNIPLKSVLIIGY